MIIRQTAAALSIFAVLAGAALAEKLPKGAVELTADEVKAIYSGKSSDWSRMNAYFAPDGTYQSVRKTGESYAKGTWAVDGNKLCADFTVTFLKDSKTKDFVDCWTWYRQGDKYWTLFSGAKDQKSSYYNNEIKKLSDGDKVSKKIQKLVASN